MPIVETAFLDIVWLKVVWKEIHIMIQIVRWLARIVCLMSIGTLSLFAFGGDESLPFSGVSEVVGFLLFPVGLAIGMLIACRWEIAGGALTLLSLLGFYFWHFSAAGKFPNGPYFLLFAIPGLVLLLIGLASRFLSNHRVANDRHRKSYSGNSKEA